MRIILLLVQVQDYLLLQALNIQVKDSLITLRISLINIQLLICTLQDSIHLRLPKKNGHIDVNRFQVGKTELYQKLLKLVEYKDYFVITTNVEHQFWINGFEDERIFATQGDYGLFQCSEACHDELYDNEERIKEMLVNTVDCKIPPELVPKCPRCGAEMETNLRKDNLFVEDTNWHDANKRYKKFLDKIGDAKVVFLELGVGYNTPVIIRYPFEQWTYDNENATLIRLNRDFPDAIKENESKTISFDEDMDEIFDYWISRIF